MPAPRSALDRLLYRLPLFVVLMGISALMMLVPAAHGAAVRDWASARAFLASAVAVALVTVLVGIATQGRQSSHLARAQLVTLVATFLVLPLVLALPFWLAKPTATYSQSWFEMVSSLTTTGATLWDSPARLAPSLHLWRATVGWMGGFFMWVVAVGIFQPLNLGGFEVLTPPPLGPADDAARQMRQITRVAEPRRRLGRFALRFLPVWLGLTGALWLALILAGDDSLTALCHAMSTLSTSGITPRAEGVALAPSGVTGEVLIFLFMAFALSRRTFAGADQGGRPGQILRDPEFRLGLLIVLGVTAVLFARHWLGAREATEGARLLDAAHSAWGMLFSATSFLTTTGFVSADWMVAPAWSGRATPGLILMGLAMFGGGVATAAGGVKLLRVYALWRHGLHELEQLFEPHSVLGTGGFVRQLRGQGATIAFVVVMLFALSAAAAMLALTLTGLEIQPAVIFAVSALSTTGQIATVAGPQPVPWATLGEVQRLILALVMVVGRVETLAIVALLNPGFWRR